MPSSAPGTHAAPAPSPPPGHAAAVRPATAGTAAVRRAQRVAALLADLDAEQLVAVTIDAAPLAILAGAGAGKTRVLTRRVAHRVLTGTAAAEHTVVVTFTRRAAGELRERLAHLGLGRAVTAGTFHGLAWGLLRQWWDDTRRPPSTLLTQPGTVLGPLLRQGRRSDAPPVPLAAVTAELTWARARLVTPEAYEAAARAAGRRPPLPPATMASLYARYDEAKRTQRLVDFDDVLWRCLGALEHDDAFAAAVRWRWRHLFADEFQDVNPLQLRFLHTLRGDRPDVCVVGDPHQAIYAWNGADPSVLTDVARHLPGVTVVRLGANHRTTPEILAVAEAVLPAAGVAAAPAQHPTAAGGDVPRVHATAHEAHEAATVAAICAQAHGPGLPWRAMAVLARTHAQLEPVRAALAAARIPHRLRAASSLLEEPAVQAWARDARLHHRLADALETPETAPRASGPDGTAAPDALATVLALAHDHLHLHGGATVEEFLAWLAATGNDHPGARPDTVELVTFHAAKGLEWPLVVVTGFEDGFVPSAGAGARPAARAEEARLAYVALTRARRHLHVTWARRRTVGGVVAERSPSPWLAALEQAVHALDARDDRPAVRALLHQARTVRASGEGQAPAVSAFEARRRALEQWRADQARAAQVAPDAVCATDLLEAVAAAAPRTADELAHVPGVSPFLLRRHGEGLLSALHAAAR